MAGNKQAWIQGEWYMDSMPPLTPDDVISEANAIAQQSLELLATAELAFLTAGYIEYAAAVEEMKNDVEAALTRLVATLTPEVGNDGPR